MFGNGYLIYNTTLNKKRVGVMCKDCGWIRLSFSVHDYRQCPCPNETMVDGGEEYLRYGGMDMNKIQIVNISPVVREKKNARSKSLLQRNSKKRKRLVKK